MSIFSNLLNYIFISFISLFFLFGVGCDNSEVKKDDDSTLNIWHGKPEDFSKSFNENYEKDLTKVISISHTGEGYNGVIEQNVSGVFISETYKDGKLNGLSCRTASNGSKVEAHYRNGMLNGEMKIYDSKGEIRSSIFYKNGQVLTGE